MAILKKTEIVLDHRFDPKSCRHSLNGKVSVLHCHHYATLYTQLADDCGMLDGKKLLTDVAEDTFYGALCAYYKEHEVTELAARITIAEQYYAACGLGKMNVLAAGESSGEIELLHSHVDEGWLKKWGPRDKPVNYISCGFMAGMFSALFNKAPRAYRASETASIVAGAERSKIEVAAC